MSKIVRIPPERLERDDPLRELPELLRVPDAARLLKVSRSKIYELLASGELESVLIGGCRRIPTAAIRTLVENARNASS